MKVCSKCHTPKQKEEFYKDKRDKSGLTCACKKCTDERKKKYNHTINGLITSIYSRQKAHSKRRGHLPPQYTKQELKVWILNNNKFETLFNNWKSSGFNKNLRPSIDRLEDEIGYNLDNIQLVKWEENYKKNIQSITEKLSISVYQKNINGKIINIFSSITEASNMTGVKQKNISHTCRGIYTQTNGYVWSYKLDQDNRKNNNSHSKNNISLHSNRFYFLVSVVNNFLKSSILFFRLFHRINS